MKGLLTLLLAITVCSSDVVASTTNPVNPPFPTITPDVEKRDLLCAIDNALLKIFTSSYSSSALAYCSSLLHVPVVTSTTSTFTPTSTVYITKTPSPTTKTALTTTPTSTVTVTLISSPITSTHSTTTPVITETVTSIPTITNLVTSTPTTTIVGGCTNVLKKRTIATTLKTTTSGNFKNAIATVESSILSRGCSCISSMIVKSTTKIVATASTKTTTSTAMAAQVSVTVTPTAATSTTTITITIVASTISVVATALPSTVTVTATADVVTTVVTSSAPEVTVTTNDFYLQGSGTGDSLVDGNYAQLVTFLGVSTMQGVHFGARGSAQLFTLDCDTGVLQGGGFYATTSYDSGSGAHTFIFATDASSAQYVLSKDTCSLDGGGVLACVAAGGQDVFGYDSELYDKWGIFLSLGPNPVGPLALTAVL